MEHAKFGICDVEEEGLCRFLGEWCGVRFLDKFEFSTLGVFEDLEHRHASWKQAFWLTSNWHATSTPIGLVDAPIHVGELIC